MAFSARRRWRGRGEAGGREHDDQYAIHGLIQCRWCSSTSTAPAAVRCKPRICVVTDVCGSQVRAMEELMHRGRCDMLEPSASCARLERVGCMLEGWPGHAAVEGSCACPEDDHACS